MNPAEQTTYDTSINLKLAGTIVFMLAIVFGLQYLGFRFVVSAGRG